MSVAAVTRGRAAAPRRGSAVALARRACRRGRGSRSAPRRPGPCALGVEVGDAAGRLGERLLEGGVGEGLGREVAELDRAPALAVVVGVRVEDLVLLAAPDALVLALDLVDEVAERPPRVVLERVAGGVERVAGGAGADGGDEVDDDVGLEVAALARDLELEQPAEADVVGALPVAGRAPVGLDRGRGARPHEPSTATFEPPRRLNIGWTTSPSSVSVRSGRSFAASSSRSRSAAGRAPGARSPRRVSKSSATSKIVMRVPWRGGRRRPDVGVGALADGEVVAGVQLPAEGPAGAEDDGLRDAEAAGGLLAVGGVALAGVAERQELR
jgi:hypothetical protein